MMQLFIIIYKTDILKVLSTDIIGFLLCCNIAYRCDYASI